MSYVAGGGGEGAKKSILILVCEIKKKKIKKNLYEQTHQLAQSHLHCLSILQ
jgi:hypothetical protein